MLMQPSNNDQSNDQSQATDQQAGWTYNGGDDSTDQPAVVDGNPQPSESIGWTASEFIAHSKTFLWYLGLMVITAITAVGAFFLSGDFFIVGVIVIISVIFGYTAARKPRELPYLIDNNGLTVDKKLYPFASFKSFSVVNEGGVEAIWLLPLQRFAPGLSIYFDPNDRDKIVDILSGYLPIEERKPDFVDTLMHKIRF